MSENIIEVNKISKKYVMNQGAHYDTLRDKISSLLSFNNRNVSKEKKTFWALRDVSFSVKKGEVLGLVGRNGAGKSTLLKILSRITPPTSGNAFIKGRVGSLLEVGTGFHQELSGRENIYLNGSILGMKQFEIKKKFDEIVDFSGVEKFLDTPVKYYSSGMTTRLAFSVAAFLEPEILLVDEVLSVGDAEFQKKSLGKMEDITKNEGRTILFVSHNLSAIRELTHNSILIDEGKLIKYGKTEDILNYYSNKLVPQVVSKKLSLRTDRSGNGKVKLTDFYIVDTSGKKTSDLICGEEYSFVFECATKNNTAVSNVDISFNIAKRSGESLFFVSYSFIEPKLKKVKGSDKFIFKIPRLPLASGEYSVGARVTVNGEEADYPKRTGIFSVLSGDFYRTGLITEQNHSPVYLDGFWN